MVVVGVTFLICFSTKKKIKSLSRQKVKVILLDPFQFIVMIQTIRKPLVHQVLVHIKSNFQTNSIHIPVTKSPSEHEKQPHLLVEGQLQQLLVPHAEKRRKQCKQFDNAEVKITEF